jgi:hypothetical protein
MFQLGQKQIIMTDFDVLFFCVLFSKIEKAVEKVAKVWAEERREYQSQSQYQSLNKMNSNSNKISFASV